MDGPSLRKLACLLAVLSCSAANFAKADEVTFITDNSQQLDAETVVPAMFQPGPAIGGGGATIARPASTTRSSLQAPQSFNVRLARAPKMLGDFFGQGFGLATVESFVGRGVHHVTALDDIHLIDESGSVVLYQGGPGGSIPGSFYVPGPSPPAPDRIEGLTSNIPGVFVAVKTTETVDVYNDPMDMLADIEDAEVFNVLEVEHVFLPASGPSDIVGRMRITDNNSAMPQDRVYFDYSYFHNVPLFPGGVEVNRYAPGFEKTFFDQMASIEVRVPMGSTINSTIVTGGPADLSNYELGNLIISPKLLLASGESYAMAIGCGVAVPTADDIAVTTQDGINVLSIENESVHLQPYLGFLYAPVRSPMFAHAFVTYDVDLNGNDVLANVGGLGLTEIGTWNDQNLISANLALGSWIYQSTSPAERLQGIAVSGELHYTETINDADVVDNSGFVLGTPGADISLLNATAGGHVRVGLTTFTAGYSVPLTSADRVFDGELRAFVNRAY